MFKISSIGGEHIEKRVLFYVQRSKFKGFKYFIKIYKTACYLLVNETLKIRSNQIIKFA